MRLKSSEGMHPQLLMPTGEVQVTLDSFTNYPYQIETLARLLNYSVLILLHRALRNLYTVHSPTKALFIKLEKV